MKIKVCGMKSAANVREICLEAPDYVGFIFVEDSPRYVKQGEAAELVRSVTPGVKTVGVFRDAPLSMVFEYAKGANLSAVQLHGDEDAQYVGEIKHVLPSLSIFKAIQVAGDGTTLAALTPIPGVDLFILDSGRGGTGSKFAWRLLETYTAAIPFLLAGGVGPDDIQEVRQMAKRIPQLYGVDINSKVEVRAGEKDPALVRKVISEARAV
jgi:phosphoribosylanthranilate isomerase